MTKAQLFENAHCVAIFNQHARDDPLESKLSGELNRAIDEQRAQTQSARIVGNDDENAAEMALPLCCIALQNREADDFPLRRATAPTALLLLAGSVQR